MDDAATYQKKLGVRPLRTSQIGGLNLSLHINESAKCHMEQCLSMFKYQAILQQVGHRYLYIYIYIRLFCLVSFFVCPNACMAEIGGGGSELPQLGAPQDITT